MTDTTSTSTPSPARLDDAMERLWIEWTGGPCPVEPDTLVDVRLRAGILFEGEKAGKLRWNFVGSGAFDLIAYRLSAPSASPAQDAPEAASCDRATVPGVKALPIETAPRDGTPCLLFFGQDTAKAGWFTSDLEYPWYFIDTGLAGIGTGVNQARDGKYGPSHWAPFVPLSALSPAPSDTADVERLREALRLERHVGKTLELQRNAAHEALLDLAEWVEEDCGAELPHPHIEALVRRLRAALAGDAR